ncbi:hypothetical protein EDB80DRAFT_707078, partial [Ilyonectria destructans]
MSSPQSVASAPWGKCWRLLCLVLVQESKPGLASVEPKRKRGPGYRRRHRRRSRRGWHCLVFLSLKSFSTVVYSPRLEYDFHKRSPPIVVPQWFLFYM